MIHKCSCSSDRHGTTSAANYQDAAYGKFNRVHTVGTNKINCTVCGKETKIQGVKKDS
jgi:hypothetical protein